MCAQAFDSPAYIPQKHTTQAPCTYWKEKMESFFSHEMGFDLMKRTLQVEIPKGFIFSNHHLPILKTGIFIHPLVMKKQETKVYKKE